MIFIKNLLVLEKVTPRTKDNKSLKTKVLNNTGVFYNFLYYTYKNKYNKEINSLDKKNKKSLATKN